MSDSRQHGLTEEGDFRPEYDGPACPICKRFLAEYEQEALDCGHIVCNGCAYQQRVRQGMNRSVCANCFESPKLEE